MIFGFFSFFLSASFYYRSKYNNEMINFNGNKNKKKFTNKRKQQTEKDAWILKMSNIGTSIKPSAYHASTLFGYEEHKQ